MHSGDAEAANLLLARYILLAQTPLGCHSPAAALAKVFDVEDTQNAPKSLEQAVRGAPCRGNGHSL